MPLRLGRAAPTVGVVDLARAVAFYEGLFGFRRTFENGDPVRFVILKRDDAEVHVERVDGHVAPPQNVMHLLVVEGVDELHARCQAAGARIVSPLRDAPWGLRTFVVADPDGNKIDVGQPLT